MKQLAMIPKAKDVFGGSLAKGNPRTARPVSVKRPMHLVLKSSRAVGSRSFLLKDNSRAVEYVIRKHAKLNGVKIYDIANGGNHLHLVVKITNARLFKKFLAAISGVIARVILKAQKASAKLKSDQKFWDARPFTRIAHWGRPFDQLRDYLERNKLEALGFIKHTVRDGKRLVVTVRFSPEEISRQQRRC